MAGRGHDHPTELRGNVEDQPAFRLAHARQDGARHAVRAIDIGVKDQRSCLHILQFDRSRIADTGIVDQDIERPAGDTLRFFNAIGDLLI